MQRMNTASAVLLAAALLAGCGPPITDQSRLPQSLTVCGWNWKLQTTVAPMTLAAIAAWIGAKPVVVDVASLLCPRGACTDNDVRIGNLARDLCEDMIWARVGDDAYVMYGMVFRL
jgi:hypothetical protein